MRPKLTLDLLSVSHRSSDYPQGATALDRFWRYVAHPSDTDCHLWTGCHNGIGYGVINIEHCMYLATHVAWILAGNELGEDPNICHKCDNPPCVNPDHLFNGTRVDNMQDALQKGRIQTPFGPGDEHCSAILTEDDVRLIRFLCENERGSLSKVEFSRVVAPQFGVSHRTIEGIVYGQRWRHVR